MLKAIGQVIGAVVFLWIIFFICIQFAVGTAGI